MRLALILAALLCAGNGALAQTPDTPANRKAAAEQYVRESGLQQVISESAIMIAKAFPPQEQAAVMQSFTKYLDAEKVRSVMVASMAQRFTVEEIQATRKFLGSPTGKSITGKLRAYLGDIMPTIETATADATGKVLLEMRRKSRQPAAGQK